eukprot:g5582.t1
MGGGRATTAATILTSVKIFMKIFSMEAESCEAEKREMRGLYDVVALLQTLARHLDHETESHRLANTQEANLRSPAGATSVDSAITGTNTTTTGATAPVVRAVPSAGKPPTQTAATAASRGWGQRTDEPGPWISGILDVTR